MCLLAECASIDRGVVKSGCGEKKMESDKCAVCDNFFNDPRILPCLHSFCSKCIVSLNQDNSVTCPTCSYQSLISPDHDGDGVQSLQSNTWLRETSRINGFIHEISQSSPDSASCASCGENAPSSSYCIECNGGVCKICLKAHSKVKDLRSHVILQPDQIKPMADDSNKAKSIHLSMLAMNPVCLSHEELKLDLYCKTCESLVCVKCSIATHKGHSVTELTEQAGESQRELQTNVQEISTGYGKLQKRIHSGNEIQVEIRQLKKRKVDVIEQAFFKLHQALNQCKETLLTEASQLCTAKDVQLSMQLESLEKLLRSVKEFETLSSHVTSGDYGLAHFMSIADTLNKRAVYLKEQVDLLCCDEFVAPAISVEVNQDGLVSFIEEFGSVSDKCPTSCSTVVIPRRNVAVGVEMKVRVISLDANKIPLCKGGAKVRGTLRCPIVNNSSTSCPVVDCNDGTYIVSVVQQQLGDHQLTITINSQRIEGSPFDITAVKPIDCTKITQPVDKISCTGWQPNFIAFSDNGDMFVTTGSKICVYDKSNLMKSSFGSTGTGNLQFQVLNGIAISGEVIFVTENKGNRIQKITTGGEFLGSFGEKGSDVGQFDCLWGAAVGPDGKLYVADCSNNRVQVFSSDWNMPNDSILCHVASIDVLRPVGIDFDLESNIHITSYTAGPVRVYCPSGKFIRQYGDKNTMHYGISIDSEGQSLVADCSHGRLLVYSSVGVLVHLIEGLSNPYGVSISPDGSVWVAANRGNQQLLKYK